MYDFAREVGFYKHLSKFIIIFLSFSALFNPLPFRKSRDATFCRSSLKTQVSTQDRKSAEEEVPPFLPLHLSCPSLHATVPHFSIFPVCKTNCNLVYQGPSASAYVTFSTTDAALRCIQTVHGLTQDGRTLKATLGTTKYCSRFLNGQQCKLQDCMYLHEIADPDASFTKEDMQKQKHTGTKMLDKVAFRDHSWSRDLS